MSITKRRIAYIYPYTESNIGVVAKVNPRYDIAPADDYVVSQIKQYLDDRVDDSKYIIVLADFLWRRGVHGAFGDIPLSSDSYVVDENSIVQFELGHSDVPILYLNTDASDIQTIIHENRHMIERFELTNDDKANVPQWKWTVNGSSYDYNNKMRILFKEIRARIAEMKTIYRSKGRLGRRETDLNISMYANELYKFLYGYFRGSYEDFSSADSVREICKLVFDFLENYMNGEFSLSDEEKVWILDKLEKAKEKGFPKGARWNVADTESDMSYLDWHGKRKK